MNTPSLEGTPLTAAIFEEREDVVKYLMANGADINILVIRLDFRLSFLIMAGETVEKRVTGLGSD